MAAENHAEEGPVMSVSVETLRKLAQAAEQAGIKVPSLPDVVRMVPEVHIGQDITPLSLALAHVLRPHNIYLMDGDVVTVNEVTGELRAMDSRRLPSWAEKYCKFRSEGVRQKRDSLTAEDAGLVLASDIFRETLRPLAAVHTMRLPVLRESGELEFLEPGYDVETQIYTVDLVPYEMDWDLERAVAWYGEHCEGYPFSWPESVPDDKRGNLMENRSFSVHMAACLGVYCKACFAPGTPRPAIFYVANQAGSGKSTMVSMALNPVFGYSEAGKTPKEDAAMDSELETAARARRPYLFFDDIGGGIFSNPLNRFISAQYHSGRVMGANKEMFSAPNVTQVFATGNDIKLSVDLLRRCLAVELFLAGEVQGRKFAKFITPQYLSRPEVRRGFLSALCAMVRNYADLVREMPVERRGVPKPLASFEEWTNLIGGICVAAGYVDPTTAPDLSGSGAEDEDELKELLVRIATDAEGDLRLDRKGIVEMARKFHLLEGLVGSGDDGEIDGPTSKKLGRQLQRWRGRELLDRKGRKFRFSRQRQNKGASYPLEFLGVAKAQGETEAAERSDEPEAVREPEGGSEAGEFPDFD